MIIIKIIILYFIQIKDTDDFTSTGTRLVLIMHNQSCTDVQTNPFHWRVHNKTL